MSVLFHISLIRQNKKAITLGAGEHGAWVLTFYHSRHILTGALKVVTHSSVWGRLIELPAATKWGLHPLRVEMNCNLFRPCCSQETKWEREREREMRCVCVCECMHVWGVERELLNPGGFQISLQKKRKSEKKRHENKAKKETSEWGPSTTLVSPVSSSTWSAVNVHFLPAFFSCSCP